MLDSVYKLAAHDGRPVRKASTGKASLPGPKQVWRAGDWSHDVVTLADEPPPGEGHRPLLESTMRDGERTGAGRRGLQDAHRHFARGWAQVPHRLLALTDPARHPVLISARLQALAEELDASDRGR